ncbi:MAG: GIY-YIG nuclease family protein [Deltaproteobacteria bacterium]|nr:GIY-YIG nuclease family protein [Deltaproteobacteria bacterium]
MNNQPGTYAIVLKSASECSIRVGKLGMLRVQVGYYVYVGSAFGPGGLAARVAHHQRTSHRSRWHIDYLRSATEICEMWYTFDPGPREHQWAETLAAASESTMPFPGFGSSDCNCLTHLYHFKSKPTIASFRRRLRVRIKDHEKIFIEYAPDR